MCVREVAPITPLGVRFCACAWVIPFFQVWSCSGNSIWMTHHWLSDAIRFEIFMALINKDPFFRLGIHSFWLATCASLFYGILPDVEADIEDVCPRSGPPLHHLVWGSVLVPELFLFLKFGHALAIQFEWHTIGCLMQSGLKFSWLLLIRIHSFG